MGDSWGSTFGQRQAGGTRRMGMDTILARTLLAENHVVNQNRTGCPFMVGDWLVEPDLGSISREGTRVRLEPKVMDVLQCLSMRAGELITKRELTDCVWQVEFISDNRLTRAIADLRRALGDDASTPQYVETIPTRGYRLVVEVSPSPSGDLVHETASRFKLEGADRSFTLKEGENVIGRGTDVDIRIDSEWASRRHAKIVVHGQQATVEDLGSKNGTYVRGTRVDEEMELTDGDEIGVGRGVVLLRFVVSLGTTRTEA